MKRKIIQRLSLIILVTLIMPDINAQQPKPASKYTPPAVKTILGKRTDSVAVAKDEATRLIALPLQAKDEKNAEYPIESYRFLYKRKTYLENPQTGKVDSSFSTVGQRFIQTPLPDVWVKNIQNGIQAGEEFLFFDIIVRDRQGQKFYAQPLKIRIQ